MLSETVKVEETEVAEETFEDEFDQHNQFNSYKSTENRSVVVKTIDGSIIRGNINLNSETLPMDRVSDLLIKGQNKFLIMYNASLNEQNDAAVIVNKSQIVWVMEETENR
jgi:protein-arginine kinase